jgi:RNA polymerase sigma factor (sigma-70 family)
MKTETEIKELLSRALTNDRQALAEILNEYGPKMFYETRLFFYDRKAAKEVEQNALRAAFSKLREAADADNVDEWFSDFVEKEALKNILPVDDPGEQYDDYTETDELVTAYSDVPEGREECMAEILKVLDTLPSDERTASVLHFYKHLSVYETAAKMGISAGGVRTLLTSAKARIHQSGEDLGTFISAIDEIHPDSTPPSESTLKIESFVQNPEEAQPTIMVSGLQEVAEAGQTKPFAEKEGRCRNGGKQAKHVAKNLAVCADAYEAKLREGHGNGNYKQCHEHLNLHASRLLLEKPFPVADPAFGFHTPA